MELSKTSYSKPETVRCATKDGFRNVVQALKRGYPDPAEIEGVNVNFYYIVTNLATSGMNAHTVQGYSPGMPAGRMIALAEELLKWDGPDFCYDMKFYVDHGVDSQ